MKRKECIQIPSPHETGQQCMYIICTVKPPNRLAMGPTLSGPFREVIGLRNQNIYLQIKAIDDWEWLICGGGRFERFHYVYIYVRIYTLTYITHYDTRCIYNIHLHTMWYIASDFVYDVKALPRRHLHNGRTVGNVITGSWHRK